MWGETCLLLLIVWSCLFISIFNQLCCPCEQIVRVCCFVLLIRYWRIVTVPWLCVQWKWCGWGVISRSYFTICTSENTEFRQIRTRDKKWPENFAKTFSDALAILIFFRRWQVPHAVTSSTWQTSQLVKLTGQVDLSPCSLASLQITWQDITCQKSTCESS